MTKDIDPTRVSLSLKGEVAQSARGGSESSEGLKGSEGSERDRYAWKLADPILYPLLHEYARKMRNNPTEGEVCLWQWLKGKVEGYRFRRQFVIGEYIADFACIEAKLVIEVDGGYHSTEEQRVHDSMRTDVLNRFGYQVLRFTNEEVIANTKQVYDIILKHLKRN